MARFRPVAFGAGARPPHPRRADRLSSTLCVWLTEEERIVWENALEIARRVSGAEISPGRALEYMAAEFIATWGVPPTEDKETSADAEIPLETATKTVDTAFDARDPLICAEVEGAFETASAKSYAEVRKLVLERDGWKCTYPGCNARRELHVHHLEFRSLGGGHEPWNLTTLCTFHHALLHKGNIRVKGRAPHELDWTPPKLMREALERRRNRRANWVGELEVREWPGPPSEAGPVLAVSQHAFAAP